jgi:hypothetical protein
VHQARLAALAAQQLAGAVGQHLVDVHVGLRARAGLPHHQRELARVLAGQHLIGGGVDGLGLLGIQQTQRMVDRGRGLLDLRQRGNDLARLLLAADVEVLQRALRLRAPEPVGRNVDGAEGVFPGAWPGGWKCLSWDSLKANKAAQLAGGDLATVGRKTHWHAHACQQSGPPC